MKWKTYRLYKNTTAVSNSDVRGMEAIPCADTLKPTRLTFKARTQKEANNKMVKIVRDYELTRCLIAVVEEKEGG